MRRRAVAVLSSLAAAVAGLGVATLRATPAASVPVLQIGEAHAEFEPTVKGNDPIFILIIGSDSRPGTALEDGLCDSIHILGINPKARRATLLGIPRDSYVPLASGGTGKINSALPRGGLQVMIDTVEDLSGVTFDYYALTGFEGVTRIVDALGGLRINVPYSFEGHLGTAFQEGRRTLTGAEALEFSRTRKTIAHGDFDRSMNQGRILLAAMTQFRKEFRRDPIALFQWLIVGKRNVHTDVPLDQLMTLAFSASRLGSPKRVTNLVTVGRVGSVGGASVVFLPSPNPLLQDLAEDGYILPADVPAEAMPSG